MAIHVATGSKGKFMYQPNIRAWKGGFYFESNPGLIMWAHRLPELVAYMRKDDSISVKVILSDAFQAEVAKNGFDLYQIIDLARDFFSVDGNKVEELVPAVVDAITTMQTKEAKKPIQIKTRHKITSDPETEEVISTEEQETAEFYESHPEFEEAINS